jgi:hypothetical protein
MNQAPGQRPTLPPDLTLQRLAQTLEPSRDRHNLIQEFDGDTPTLHKFESKRPMDPKKQVQCRSCQSWGHGGLCYMMCKLVHIQRWIKANPEEAEKQADMFATSNSKKMINIMHVDDEESLYQGIENMMHALGDESDPPIEMKKLQTAPQLQQDIVSQTTGALHPCNVVPEYIDARIMPASKQQANIASSNDGVVMKKMKINFAK